MTKSELIEHYREAARIAVYSAEAYGNSNFCDFDLETANVQTVLAEAYQEFVANLEAMAEETR